MRAAVRPDCRPVSPHLFLRGGTLLLFGDRIKIRQAEPVYLGVLVSLIQMLLTFMSACGFITGVSGALRRLFFFIYAVKNSQEVDRKASDATRRSHPPLSPYQEKGSHLNRMVPDCSLGCFYSRPEFPGSPFRSGPWRCLVQV